MRHIRAVAAGVVLIGLVVGLPVLLWFLAGSPVPHQLPAWDEVRATLSRPDTTGQVLWIVLKAAGWIAWVTFAISAVTELAAQARRRPAPRLRGFGLQQRVAAGLVAALLGLTGAQAAMALPAHAAPPTAATTTAVTFDMAGVSLGGVLPADPVALVPTQVVHEAAAAPQATTVYTVQDGDSLWKIAETQLGNPHRWQEIYDLNVGVVQADGYALGDAGWVEPGWQLTLPEAAAPQATTPVVERTYTVQPGDNLSQIAKDQLGDAGLYPEIFAASTDTVQPDGRHLSDPSLIRPGWSVTIPGTTAADPPTETPASSTAAGPGSATTPEAPAAGADEGQAGQPAPEVQGADATPGADTQASAEQKQPHEAARQSGSASQAEGTNKGQDQTQTTAHDTRSEWAPWVLAGLTGGGAVLAGSLLLALKARRRAQFRHRRPGRTLAAPEPWLAPVEKTVVMVGSGTADTVEYMDAVLRRLAGVVATDGGTMPDLVAVELTGTHVVLHLGAPWQLAAPWECDDDGHRWQLPMGLSLDEVGPDLDEPAPYPLLVTVGSDDEGVWLLNVEDLVVTLVGDEDHAQDFARYMVAEIGCNPWSAWTTVDCVGLGAELVGLNPDRIRYHDPTEPGDPLGRVLDDAMSTVTRAGESGSDVVTARSVPLGADSWAPRVVLVDATCDDPSLDPLLEAVTGHAGQTATSVIIAGSHPSGRGVVIEVTADGRVRVPDVGLDLVTVGLDVDEATECAELVAHSEIAVDPVPVSCDTVEIAGWRAWSDQAGALRVEHTLPRNDTWYDADAVSSLLPAADETYVRSAATLPDELPLLAPLVSESLRDEVEAADPGLDADVTAWFDPDSPLPKLRVLGPVQVWTVNPPPARRAPYFTELLTFLALQPHGTTPSQVAEAFNTSTGKVREYVRIVRDWLGTDPRTGTPHLPDAQPLPGQRDPVYQVHDVLIDLDLFRRLRVRGMARGADGLDDLLTALSLVAGRPFDDPAQQRPGGWAWLVDGERADENALVAVVDAAHTVVTHALAVNDLRSARLAAETAQLAAPDEEIINLDLAAVASAEGRHAEASKIIIEDIGNRSDDGHAPPELSTRTQAILAVHPDWITTQAS